MVAHGISQGDQLLGSDRADDCRPIDQPGHFVCSIVHGASGEELEGAPDCFGALAALEERGGDLGVEVAPPRGRRAGIELHGEGDPLSRGAVPSQIQKLVIPRLIAPGAAGVFRQEHLTRFAGSCGLVAQVGDLRRMIEGEIAEGTRSREIGLQSGRRLRRLIRLDQGPSVQIPELVSRVGGRILLLDVRQQLGQIVPTAGGLHGLELCAPLIDWRGFSPRMRRRRGGSHRRSDVREEPSPLDRPTNDEDRYQQQGQSQGHAGDNDGSAVLQV